MAGPELAIKFTGDASQLDRVIGGVKDNVGGLASSMGGALKMGAIAGAAGIAALTGAVAVSGISFDSMRQQAEIAFGTMLGSGEAAKKMLDDLQKFAAATPFEFSEVVSAAKQLTAFGVSAGDVTKVLTQLGDISAGVGVSVNDLAAIYGKAKTQGRLMADDINQLTGRGIPIIGELAKQLGVADSEVRKMVEKGAVGFPQLEKAFESLTSKGGRFSGLMEAQSHSFDGLMSTLKDTFSQVSGAIMGPLFGEMTKYAQKLVDWTSSPEFNQMVTNVTAWATQLTDAVGTIFFGIMHWDFSDIYAMLYDALGPDVAENVVGPFLDVFGAIPAVIQGVFKALQTGNIQDAVNSIYGALGGREYASKVADSVGKFLTPYMGLVDWFKGTFIPTMARVPEIFKAFMSGLQTGNFQQLTNVLYGVFGNDFSTLVTNTLNTATAVLGQFSSYVSGTVVPALRDLGTWVVTNVVPALVQLGGWILANGIPALVQFGGFIMSTVLPAIGSLVTWVRGNLLPALNQLWVWVQGNLIPALQSFASSILGALIPVLGQLGGFILGTVVPAMIQFGGWLGTNIVPLIQSLVGWIVGTFIPALGQLWAFVIGNIIPAFASFVGTIGTLVLPVVMSLGNWIVGTLIPALRDIFYWVGNNVVPILKDLAGAIGTIIGGLGTALTTKIGEWSKGLQQMADAAKKVLDFLGGIINAVGKAIIPNWGQGPAPAPAQGYALGGTNVPGGLALVGEHGPELVALPRGSNVVSNATMTASANSVDQLVAELSRLSAGGVGRGGVTVPVYATVNGEREVQRLANEISLRLALETLAANAHGQ